MKIQHVLRKYNPAEWGGTETALQRLFAGFQEHPVESILYAPKLPTEPLKDPLAELGCRVERFRACVPIWGVDQAFKDQMISVAGNLMTFDLPGKLWREKQVDLVHTHTLGRLGGIAIFVAERKKLPLVVTIHGGVLDLPAALKASMNQKQKGWEWGRIFGALLRTYRILEKADAILTCNEKEAALMKEKYPHQRVIVQPHGVALKNYAADCREKVWELHPEWKEKQILFSLGRIDPVKNQLWLVEHSGPVFAKNPQSILVLVGSCTDAAYGEKLKESLRRLNLEKRVYWLGGLPPNDPVLVGLLQAAQAVLLPSLSETFGLVLLEAWAAGSSVMTSRTSGGTALVKDSQNGWIFDLERPESYQCAAHEALNNPDKRRAMAQAGRDLCREYDLSQIAGRVKRLYEELIHEKRATRHPAR